MKIIDEYFQATSQRLYNYPQYKAMLKSAIAYQNKTVERLAATPGATYQYGERVAASTGEKSGTEIREQYDRDLWKANRTIDQLQGIVHPIEYALQVLDLDELLVVCLRFWGVTHPVLFDQGTRGIQWDEFEGHGYSRRTAIRICNQAKWKIRAILFPCRVDEHHIGIIHVE